MKAKMKKVSEGLKLIFGYGMMICLFVGGFTFFGYLAAMIIGGEIATAICTFIYQGVVPVMVCCTTSLVLLGLAAMYCAGETALTGRKKA